MSTIKKDKKILFENITLWFNEFQDSGSGLTDWHGSFYLSTADWIEPGAPYQITLSDGRSGDIIISDVQKMGDAINVMFQGSGGLG